MKNLDSLQLFVEVVRKKSLTRAAISLGITKSTVSRKIQALEKELGVTLINRDPRHFSLTENGFSLFKSGEQILKEAEDAFEKVTDVHSDLSGTIKISTTSDLSLIYLATPLAKFSKKYPLIDFFIDLNPATIDLKTEGVDIAIRPGMQKDSGLFIRKIDEIQPAFFASSEYIKKNGRPKKIEDLKKHNIVSTKMLSLDGSHYKPKIFANNMSFVKQLTIESAAIGFLSEEFVFTDKKSSSLVKIFPEKSFPKTPIYLVFTNKKLSKRVSLLVKEIIEYREKYDDKK